MRTPSATCWRALYSRLRHLALAAAAGRRVSHREKVAAAGREGRLVRRSQAPPVGGRRTERDGSRRPGGPACVPWQPPAEKAGLCADLMRRLLAGALQTTAGREGRLVCQSHAPPAGKRLTERGWQPPAGRAVLCAELMRSLLAGALQREGGSRRPGGPACVPISCAREKTSRAACWRAPRPGRVARSRLRDLRCHELRCVCWS